MPLKVIICGGGIGGLAAACFLRRHHHVTVLERVKAGVVDADYGLSVTPNAWNLLLKLGLNEDNLDMAIFTHFWHRDTEDHEARVDHFDTRLKFGGPTVLLSRAVLQKELRRLAVSVDGVGKPATVLEGTKVTKVDTVAGKVWTEKGAEHDCDMIVGADGINSLVRSEILQLDQGSYDTITHDMMAFVCQFPIEAVRGGGFDYLLKPEDKAGLVMFRRQTQPPPKQRILLFHISHRELQVIAYTGEREFAEQFRSKNTSIIKDVPQTRVVDEFAPHFAESVVGIFKLSNRIDAWRIRDIKPLKTWVRGKAVLLGDAAHAVTPHAGQGCNITVEDAEALAYFLQDVHTVDRVYEQLERFTAFRKPRTDLVGRAARALGGIPSDEDNEVEIFNGPELGKQVHGYQGVEHALGLVR